MKILSLPCEKVKITKDTGPYSRGYTPTVNIKLYSKSAVFTYSGTRAVASVGSTRGAIKESTRKSENSFRIAWEDYAKEIARFWITLTYPANFPLNGRVCEAHLKELKRRLKRIGVIDNIWRKEFQERGALHINLFVPVYVDKEWLSRTWYEIVKSGDPKHLLAGTGIEPVRDLSEALSYLLSYTKKDTQKQVPENFGMVGRFWGCSKKLVVQSEITRFFNDDFEMHRWLRPMKKAYHKGIVRQWKRSDGKRYKVTFKKYQGFKAWGASKIIQTIIERSDNENSIREQERSIKRKKVSCEVGGVSTNNRKVFRVVSDKRRYRQL